VLAPVLVLFVLLTIAFGRVEVAKTQLVASARAGAEAAAVSSPSQAFAASVAAASAASGSQTLCTRFEVQPDLSDFAPGGEVAVTVSCSIDWSSLGAPGLSGVTRVSATQTAPVDKYRTFS
jgi:TadE-like protein